MFCLFQREIALLCKVVERVLDHFYARIILQKPDRSVIAIGIYYNNFIGESHGIDYFRKVFALVVRYEKGRNFVQNIKIIDFGLKLEIPMVKITPFAKVWQIIPLPHRVDTAKRKRLRPNYKFG